MSVKILRTVKRARTAIKIMETTKKPITVFLVFEYGFRLDGSIASNIVRNRDFEVIEGVHTVYPFALRINQKALIYKP